MANMDPAWEFDDNRFVEVLDNLVIVRHNPTNREIIYEKREYDDLKDAKTIFEKASKELIGEMMAAEVQIPLRLYTRIDLGLFFLRSAVRVEAQAFPREFDEDAVREAA